MNENPEIRRQEQELAALGARRERLKGQRRPDTPELRAKRKAFAESSIREAAMERR